ncbi:Fc.00g039320.m01.CDS01 [Cosmosporella sp. VM-42]
MLPERYRIFSVLTSILSLSLFFPLGLAQPNPSVLYLRTDDPVDKEDPLRDPAYLPAQIGGIVGAYAVSLVLVAITLLALSKKRREHLSAGNDEIDFSPVTQELVKPRFEDFGTVESLAINTQVPPAQNFSYPSPTKSEFEAPGIYIHPSPVSASTVGHPGVSPLVDQRVVFADRAMAQSQLEEMYKHVMEHEDAKKRGLVYEAPIIPGAVHQPRSSASGSVTSFGSQPKKERNKPANLNLSKANEEKTQSRTSSLLSALRSPKKKAMRGVSISSPMMTPQSATFPRHHVESQEMSAIPPRHYAPPPPPPVPKDQVPFGAVRTRSTAPVTPPDISPESVQSIDERIEAQLPLPPNGHNRSTSAPTEGDPQSATSEHSQAPLVSLPHSPKPGARFPTLPASPKPGATFHRSNAPLALRSDSASSLPSAVRSGGALPLRAYDTGLASPSITSQTTKQTVFERKTPLSPSGAQTPYTAGLPYSPYQPFTPCMPMTPSLITREDRKRMKRMVPKTPTLEMVKAAEDIW